MNLQKLVLNISPDLNLKEYKDGTFSLFYKDLFLKHFINFEKVLKFCTEMKPIFLDATSHNKIIFVFNYL